VQNQRENVILLLSNIFSHRSSSSKDGRRSDNDRKSKAVIELHNRTFGDDAKEMKGGSYRGCVLALGATANLLCPSLPQFNEALAIPRSSAPPLARLAMGH
jgi:hypothetical protein